MPAGFRRDREGHVARVRELLSAYGTVHATDLIDSDDSGRAAGKRLTEHDLDLLVCAPTMAAPPSYTLAALEQLPNAPIVVLGIQESEAVPDDYDTKEATRRSLPVGLVMLTNTLVREGRPFSTFLGSWDDPDLAESVDTVMRGALAAARVKGARLLSIGNPIPGYADIEATASELSLLGVDVMEVDREMLNEAFAGVSDSAVARQVELEMESADSVEVDDEVLQRSARLACAMRDLCASEGVVGGAVNCHGSVLRWNPGVGITACLGVSRLSAEGLPFACTGDIPTAIALILGKATAGSALYCELYQLDIAHDWVLVANGGEGDFNARDRTRPVSLLTEDHYMGDRGPGTAVAFSLPVGEATLISLSSLDAAKGGWRLVVAEGEIIGSQHPEMEGPNGMFRFSHGSVQGAFQRWSMAGATHHAALIPGAQGYSLRGASALLGIEFYSV